MRASQNLTFFVKFPAPGWNRTNVRVAAPRRRVKFWVQSGKFSGAAPRNLTIFVKFSKIFGENLKIFVKFLQLPMKFDLQLLCSSFFAAPTQLLCSSHRPPKFDTHPKSNKCSSNKCLQQMFVRFCKNGKFWSSLAAEHMFRTNVRGPGNWICRTMDPPPAKARPGKLGIGRLAWI